MFFDYFLINETTICTVACPQFNQLNFITISQRGHSQLDPQFIAIFRKDEVLSSLLYTLLFARFRLVSVILNTS